MTIWIQRGGWGYLNLEGFPQPLSYLTKRPKDLEAFVEWQVTDQRTEKEMRVFISKTALRSIGISVAYLEKLQRPEEIPHFLASAADTKKLIKQAAPIVAQHTNSQYKESFEKNASHTNRRIWARIQKNGCAIAKDAGCPTLYLDWMKSTPEIFIHWPKGKPCGFGSYGEVKKSIRITAAEENERLVAKKTFKRADPARNIQHFDKETQALGRFANQKGIVSLISAGIFGEKRVLFMPLYKCNLWDFFRERNQFSSELNQWIDVMGQLLEGLTAISRQGIHGDLSPNNILVREKKGKIEAVISDFGSFRPFGEEEYGLCTYHAMSPEYALRKVVSTQQDVWALGFLFYQMIIPDFLAIYAKPQTLKDMQLWLETLEPDWVLPLLENSSAPPFLSSLINNMLNPVPELRYSAEQALQSFVEGRTCFLAAEAVREHKSSTEEESQNLISSAPLEVEEPQTSTKKRSDCCACLHLCFANLFT